MASDDQYLRLRRMTGEVGSNTYTNTDLDLYINEADGDLNVAASRIWGEKASDYADLVNQSEAGSSRSNSDLFAHATAQKEYFSALGGEVAPTSTAQASTTRAIVRA